MCRLFTLLTSVRFSFFTAFGICLILLGCNSSEDQTEAGKSVIQPAPRDTTNFIYRLLRDQENPVLDSVLNYPDKFRVQVLYTQINRNEDNEPVFTQFSYLLDSQQYFYPASTVKFPVSLLALQRLSELNLDRGSTMLTDSAYNGQTAVTKDTSAENGLPSVEHYIKKILVASNNDAYNRLYEFLGQEYINRQLEEKGYTDTRIIHRLSIPLSEEQNRYTNPVSFIRGDEVLYEQELVYNAYDFMAEDSVLLGKGEVVNDSLLNRPKDFAAKNFMPLDELNRMLQAALFPEYIPEAARFNIAEDDYRFLYQYMSQLPRETAYPPYDAEEYYDSYVKFLLFGDTKQEMPQNIRIFNKIGQAYGFLTDAAYIIDYESQIEFMLAATVFVNENQIFNDSEYEYEEIGLPFMGALGRAFFEYELVRERENVADLGQFRIEYDNCAQCNTEEQEYNPD
jgi:hypothetical protein